MKLIMEYGLRPYLYSIMNDEDMYLKSLDEKEVKSYIIAKSHLGSSFELKKSIGFIKWKIDNTQKSIELFPPNRLSE